MLRKPGYKKFWNVAPVYGKAAAAPSTTTWNASDKSANLSLSAEI
jgi:hypothetical protein